MIFLFTDFGIKLTETVHPICLPYSSNSKKREDRDVKVMGFATGDSFGSTSTTLKAAEMIVFTQKECNDNLDKELNKNQECKLLINYIFSIFLVFLVIFLSRIFFFNSHTTSL